MASDTPPTDSHRRDLLSRSFIGLILTQTLGTFNDNMLRWLAVPLGQQIPQLTPGVALALGGVCFTLPYLLLAPAAGYLADRYSKRNVIIGCKVAEVLIMLLGIGVILLNNIWLLFGVVALAGAQSALFAPSKFGSLPEILDVHHLSAGNGVMGLVTVVSTALGNFAGYGLFSLTNPNIRDGVLLRDFWPAAVAFLSIAAVGLATSFLIAYVPAANPARVRALNPITQTLPALSLLWGHRGLRRASLGIAFFWAMASLAQLNIDRYGAEMLHLPPVGIGILPCMLVLGVGAGSLLAGYWSGGRVELGLVPLGAMGIAVSSLLVFLTGTWIIASPNETLEQAFFWSSVSLVLLGISAGLFNVPLEAYMQHVSDVKNRGTILAGSNFISFAFILLSCGLFTVLHDVLRLTPAQIFMVAALGTIPVVYDAFRLLPDITIRFLFWLASHTVYRVRVYGDEHLPGSGGALIVANHVTWMDGVLLTSLSPRMIRFLVWADYANKPGLRWLGKTMRVIPIKATDGPKSILQSLQTARDALLQGELVGLFAEGQLTRTGRMQPFQPGLMKIIEGTGCPVIPVYLHGLWGSIFSFHGGKCFWKRPRFLPYPVTVVFGAPIHQPQSADHVRQAVELLGVQAMQLENPRELIPVRQFIRQCKQNKSKPKLADSSGLETTGIKTLIGALAFRRVLERNVLSRNEPMVGLLLPPSVGGVLANLALALSGRTAVNLNYTLSDDVLNYCIRAAGIKHVLTSRKFLERKPCKIEAAEAVYLEDVKEQVTGRDKAMAALAAYTMPATVLERMLGLHRISPNDVCTVIFTSGSTGEPKGVMLTHRNVSANIAAVNELLNPKAHDVILGVLPFFHSFGYTVTIWLPACFVPKAVYHYNPLDAKMVGKLSGEHKVTILIATPTFLRTYMKRCTQEQFSSLDLVVVGAEKMPLSLAEEFKARFGVEPTEGYGTTELSPVAAVNIPPNRMPDGSRSAMKLGTVGRVLPGCAAKVVDPDTFQDRGLNTEGLLLIKGPNVMLGYLHQPEKTAAVIRDGWYNTGDFAQIDNNGFITITGRQSRFSKIAGEMVPHIRIEEELCRIVEGDCPEDSNEDVPEIQLAVTSVPDNQRGEKIVVVHKPLSKPVEQILKELGQVGLPNIWMPSAENFLEVEEIPLLGTGKLDLCRLKEVALAAYSDQAGDSSSAA